jgi:hypothetical protein
MERKLIGQYFIDDRLISQDQLQKALETQANSLQGGNTPLIGTVLVQMGAVNEQDVTFELEKQERDRMRV